MCGSNNDRQVIIEDERNRIRCQEAFLRPDQNNSLGALSKIYKCILKVSTCLNSRWKKDGLRHIFKFFDEQFLISGFNFIHLKVPEQVAGMLIESSLTKLSWWVEKVVEWC